MSGGHWVFCTVDLGPTDTMFIAVKHSRSGLQTAFGVSGREVRYSEHRDSVWGEDHGGHGELIVLLATR